MSYHTIRRFGRFAWAKHEKYGRNFMWSDKGTYHRLVGNLWWFKPPAGVSGCDK
jgi:hypothetical protein